MEAEAEEAEEAEAAEAEAEAAELEAEAEAGAEAEAVGEVGDSAAGRKEASSDGSKPAGRNPNPDCTLGGTGGGKADDRHEVGQCCAVVPCVEAAGDHSGREPCSWNLNQSSNKVPIAACLGSTHAE